MLPDGCRDVLIIGDAERLHSLLLTERDHSARRVVVEGGRQLHGFRLAPGVPITQRAEAALCELAAQWRTREPVGLARAVEPLLSDDFCPSAELEHIINALAAPGATVSGVARTCAVSERALRRHLHATGLGAPDYWRVLGRARRAARTLHDSTPLSAHALHHGFSDQAHMTREFRRWFGRTPSQLRRDEAMRAQLDQPGLGNWTGEHSSTR